MLLCDRDPASRPMPLQTKFRVHNKAVLELSAGIAYEKRVGLSKISETVMVLVL